MRLVLALALLASCAPATEGDAPLPAGPYAVVLGTAQDGGLPQLGCRAACCERARVEPSAARAVASILVVDPEAGQRWLLDATPDLPSQVERARAHQDPRDGNQVENTETWRKQTLDSLEISADE